MSHAAPPDLLAKLSAARDAVAAASTLQPRMALILGSGLGGIAEELADVAILPYDRIPGWPLSTVEGHAGRLVLGRLEGVPVAVMQGRVHLYEGYAPWEITFPTRALALLGCEALLVTNAAGAIDTSFAPGDLMLITDHLNLQGTNPCIGANLTSMGPRFFDMTYAYHPPYLDAVRAAALSAGIELREGVYAALSGPSFETPAEIRMLRTLGASAVGMSTVPEVIVANHAGVKVVGISMLSNMAAGVLGEPIDHGEVMETGERVRDELTQLIRGLVANIAVDEGWAGAEGAPD